MDKGIGGGYGSVSLGSLTTTGANETLRATPAANIPASLLQAKFLTERHGPSETWVPVGIAYIITTGITVTAAVITLRKNGVNAATGGAITLPIQALGANEIFAPFPVVAGTANYTFATPDAIGDVWSFVVSTTSTAGVVTIRMIYGIRVVPGVAVGVAY